MTAVTNPDALHSAASAVLHRLPVVRQLRQSVGLQRGMLIAGLIITGDLPADGGLRSRCSRRTASSSSGMRTARSAPSNRRARSTCSAPPPAATTPVLEGDLGYADRRAGDHRRGAALDLRRRAARAGVRLLRWPARSRAWSSSPDAVYAFPSLLLAIVAAIAISGGQSSFWGGIFAAAISITVVFIPQYFRVIRAETVRIKSEAYVESAQVMGTEHGPHHVPPRVPQRNRARCR